MYGSFLYEYLFFFFFFLYSNEIEIMSKLGEVWKSLSEEEKKPYQDKADQAKKDFVAAGGFTVKKAKKTKLVC